MFAREVLCLHHGLLYDQTWFLFLGFLIACLDASGAMKKTFLPVIEIVTVATKEVGRPKPNKLVSSHPLAYQMHQNAIYVRSKRKAAYKFQGDVLNPCEKPAMANGWVLSNWTKPGMIVTVSYLYAVGVAV